VDDVLRRTPVLNEITNSMEHILLENPAVPQLIMKFSMFYGNRRFITVFTIARHLSLS
jgi:hypothetical protein